MLHELSFSSSCLSSLSGEDECSATSVLAMDKDNGDLLKTFEPGFRNNEYWLLVFLGLRRTLLLDRFESVSASFHFIGIARFSSEFSSFV